MSMTLVQRVLLKPLPLLVIGSLVLGVLAAWMPGEFLPYLVAVFFLGCVFISMFAYPELLLYFVFISSAFTSLLRNFDSLSIGATSLTVSGLRWMGLAGAALLLGSGLWLLRSRIRFPRRYWLFLPFLAWTLARWVTSPWGTAGLKDVLFYALPIVVGLYTLVVLSVRGERLAQAVENVALWTAYLPGVLYAILIPAGLVYYTENGPKGIMEPRGVVVFLLVILTIALAGWRYGRGVGERRRGRFVSLVIVSTILFTLSRTASLVAVALIGLHRINPSKPLRILFMGVLVAICVLALLLSIPPLRERFFFGDQLDLSGEYLTRALNTSGRNRMWPVTYIHAQEKLAIGWGPGSARLLVASDVFAGEKGAEYHPHNEYLQILHDLGLIGLILWVLAWVPMLWVHWRQWKDADRMSAAVTAKWEMAAVFCIVIMLLTAITDNTFHYPHVTGPSFVVIAVADYWHRVLKVGRRV